MERILYLTNDPDQRDRVIEDLSAEPRFENTQIDVFGGCLPLAMEAGDPQVLLFIVNYELSYNYYDSSRNKLNESIELANTLNDKNGPPVLFIGPVDRSSEAKKIMRMKRVEELDEAYMYDLEDNNPGTDEEAQGKKPAFIWRILSMIDSQSTKSDRLEPPMGLIELTVDDDESMHCATTLIYRNGRIENGPVNLIQCDSHIAEDMRDFTDALPELNSRKNFFNMYKKVGDLTRKVLNYNEDTEGAIIELLKKAGGIENVWIRFRVSDYELSRVPFEAVLRCDCRGKKKPNEFQLKYSPVYRIVGDQTSADSQPNFSLFSGLCKNAPRSINCLIIDATTAGTVDRGNYSDLPKNLPNIEANAKKEIDFLSNLFSKVKESGSIVEIGKIDFSSDEEKKDPEAALDRIINSCNWDIIHFSGHSIFIPGDNELPDKGFIFLPGQTGALPVPIITVADWFKQADLVYMSSCESAQPAFVNALADGGVSTIIGFRWQVTSLGATQFSGLFYLKLFQDKTGNIESAFVEAQRILMDPGTYPLPRELHRNAIWREPDIKAWASPMLVMQIV